MIMLKHWLLMWLWVNKHRRVGRPQNNPNQKKRGVVVSSPKETGKCGQ
jgi:hypothetical protein